MYKKRKTNRLLRLRNFVGVVVAHTARAYKTSLLLGYETTIVVRRGMFRTSKVAAILTYSACSAAVSYACETRQPLTKLCKWMLLRIQAIDLWFLQIAVEAYNIACNTTITVINFVDHTYRTVLFANKTNSIEFVGFEVHKVTTLWQFTNIQFFRYRQHVPHLRTLKALDTTSIWEWGTLQILKARTDWKTARDFGLWASYPENGFTHTHLLKAYRIITTLLLRLAFQVFLLPVKAILYTISQNLAISRHVVVFKELRAAESFSRLALLRKMTGLEMYSLFDYLVPELAVRYTWLWLKL